MITHFPIDYTLESGTKVTVDKTNSNAYEFNLRTEAGDTSHFTFVDDGRDKDTFEETLSFEQLDALRTFWRKNEDII